MGEKKPETASEVLRSINEFLLGPEPDFESMSEEEVKAFLRKNQVDSTSVFRAARNSLEEAQGQLELGRARKKRLRIERLFPEVRRATSGLRDGLLDQIRTLAGEDTAAVYARKFQSAPEEDLRTLVEDFDLLDQLDFDDDED